jgi:hypothetical protein
MNLDNATELNRKSGVAQWRDLRFLFRFSRRRSVYRNPPVEISQQSVRDPGRIGKPAQEKQTYLAYLAYRALLFLKLGTPTSVQSRNNSGTFWSGPPKVRHSLGRKGPESKGTPNATVFASQPCPARNSISAFAALERWSHRLLVLGASSPARTAAGLQRAKMIKLITLIILIILTKQRT